MMTDDNLLDRVKREFDELRESAYTRPSKNALDSAFNHIEYMLNASIRCNIRDMMKHHNIAVGQINEYLRLVDRPYEDESREERTISKINDEVMNSIAGNLVFHCGCETALGKDAKFARVRRKKKDGTTEWVRVPQ